MRDVRKICRKEIATINKIETLVHCRENEEEDDEDEEEEEKKHGDDEDDEVRMTSGLKKHILRLPDSVWKPYRSDSQTESECADVFNYWPEEDLPVPRARPK